MSATNGQIASHKVKPVYDASGDVVGLSAGGEVIARANTVSRFVLIGDSILAAENGTRSITAMTRSGNVVTCTAASHAHITGQRIKISNAMPDSFNGEYSITRIDANSFSYQNAGPDESATLSGHPSGGNFESRTMAWTNPNGWFTWTNNLYFSGAINVVKNIAAGGWQADYAASTEGLAFIEKELGTTEFTDLIVAYGVNDLIHDMTPEQIAENLQTLCRFGLSKNARVWVDAVKPVGSSHGSADKINKKAPVVNRLLAEYAKTTNNVVFVDTYSTMVDPNTGLAIANTVQSDHIHPSAWASRTKFAPAWYAALSVIVKVNSTLVKSLFDNYGNDTSSPVLFDDAPWIDTAGGTTGGTVTGGVCLNFNVQESGSGSVAGSIAARSDGFGYNQLLELTAAANNDAVELRVKTPTLARFVGKKVKLFASVEVTGNTLGNLKALYPYMTQVVGGVTAYCYGGNSVTTNALWGTTDDTITCVLSTPAFEIDASASAITIVPAVMQVAGAGTPTLKVGRVTVVEVTD